MARLPADAHRPWVPLSPLSTDGIIQLCVGAVARCGANSCCRWMPREFYAWVWEQLRLFAVTEVDVRELLPDSDRRRVKVEDSTGSSTFTIVVSQFYKHGLPDSWNTKSYWFTVFPMTVIRLQYDWSVYCWLQDDRVSPSRVWTVFYHGWEYQCCAVFVETSGALPRLCIEVATSAGRPFGPLPAELVALVEELVELTLPYTLENRDTDALIAQLIRARYLRYVPKRWARYVVPPAPPSAAVLELANSMVANWKQLGDDRWNPTSQSDDTEKRT